MVGIQLFVVVALHGHDVISNSQQQSIYQSVFDIYIYIYYNSPAIKNFSDEQKTLALLCLRPSHANKKSHFCIWKRLKNYTTRTLSVFIYSQWGLGTLCQAQQPTAYTHHIKFLNIMNGYTPLPVAPSFAPSLSPIAMKKTIVSSFSSLN